MDGSDPTPPTGSCTSDEEKVSAHQPPASEPEEAAASPSGVESPGTEMPTNANGVDSPFLGLEALVEASKKRKLDDISDARTDPITEPSSAPGGSARTDPITEPSSAPGSNMSAPPPGPPPSSEAKSGMQQTAGEEPLRDKQDVPSSTAALPFSSQRDIAQSLLSLEPTTHVSSRLEAKPSAAGLGMFDNAETDQPTNPLLKKAKIAAPSQFEDAEEDDMDFEAPAYEEKLPATIPKPSTALPALQSYDSVAIGLRPPPQGGTQAASQMLAPSLIVPASQFHGMSPFALSAKQPNANGAVQNATSAASKKKPASKEKPPAKKKKPTKPTKKILRARKETEAALLLLANKDDLACVLSSHHCNFLGQEFWIFTVQQLESVLDPDAASDVKRIGRTTREAVVEKLATSKLVSVPASSGGDADVSASSPAPVPDQGSKGQNDGSGDARKRSEDDVPVGALGNGVNVEDGTNDTTGDQSVKVPADSESKNREDGETNGKAQKAAEEIAKSWYTAIQAWKKKDESDRSIPNKDKFLLDGAIACIFPAVARNFFASRSVSLRSLYDFLSLKKTETGAIISLCVAWRKQCGLPDATPLSIAKHLLGLSFRAETAVSSVPPANAFARRWVGDPIVVLTGAAREFIVEEKGVFSGKDFLDTRTKDFATNLMEWRDKKGLPPLKGSGKVAMVSAWKATVKEAIDIEVGDGKVLADVDLQALVEKAEQAPIVKEEKKAQVQPSSKNQASQEFTFDPRIPDVNAALHSPKFLVDTLDPKFSTVLHSVGIKTTFELFGAEKKQGSPLAVAVARVLPDPTKFELTIFDWCQILRKKLSGIRRVHSTTTKRKPDAEDFDTAPAPTKAKVDGGKLPSSPSKASKSSKPSKPVTSLPSKEDISQKDPFFALSAVTQTFLASLGINSAEGFLTSRTTDLSNIFIEWRAANGMPVLKGLGAIASVSGWKAQVRKVATERGLEKLAVLVPEGSASYTPGRIGRKATTTKGGPGSNAKKLSQRAKLESGANSGNRMIAHPGVLFGKPNQKIVVESAGDPAITFSFELTVRKASSASGIGLFLSYLGAQEDPAKTGSDSARRRYLHLLEATGSLIRMPYPILGNVPKEVEGSSSNDQPSTPEKSFCRPFSALEKGCGLIGLGNYDVRPLPRHGEAELAFKEVERFISDVTLGKGALDSDDSLGSSNILVGTDEDGVRQYFLYLQEPMEKGQMVELHFRTSLGSPTTVENDSPVGSWRQQIDGIISRLSSDGLRTLLNFISKLVYDKIDKSLGLLGQGDSAPTDPSKLVSDPVELKRLVVSRRRVHWTVLRIKARLKDLEEKRGRRGSDSAVSNSTKDDTSYKSILWSQQIATKLRGHPAWEDDVARGVKEEVLQELEPEIESSGVLNSRCRKKWCPLAKDLFDGFVDCLASFSTLLEEENSLETAIHSLRNLAGDSARKLADAMPTNKEDLDILTLLFAEEGEDGFRGNLPSAEKVIQMAVAQAYHDAMALSGDAPVLDMPFPTNVKVIATEVIRGTPCDNECSTSKQSSSEVVFRRVEDMETCRATINRQWYIQHQCLQVFESLLACSASILDVGIPFEPNARLAVQETLRGVADDKSLSSGGALSNIPSNIPLVFPSKVGPSEYEPHSFQLFLGLVWPSLRSAGWRLEAGDSPSDISFIPPEQTNRGRRRDKRSRMMKQERAKTRVKLAKAANDLGLGFVPKLTKRLFTRTAEMKASGLDDSNGSSERVTVSEALKRFLAKIEMEIPEENEESHKRAKIVVEQIKKSFNDLFPMILSKDGGDDSVEIDPNKSPSDYAGCEYLARLLLVLPSILYQSGLTIRLIDDTTIVIKELADFLANHLELFEERFRPEHEVYIGDKTLKPVLASRLEKLRSANADSTRDPELDEAILPEDRPDLTDFVDCVMSQVIPCRATQDDVGRKNRRISVGYAGLVCRHCLASQGEGRYFFSSIESMMTASGTIEKHIQKCPSVASEVKERLAECRRRHSDQRKGLAPGAQAAYFLRLWERLRSSKVKDSAATLHVLEMKEEKQDTETEDDDEDGHTDDFTDHVRLLDYLSKTEPWSQKPEILEAVGQYYECLEFGGRLYNTDAMPKGFSSEWLLAEVTGSAHTTMG